MLTLVFIVVILWFTNKTGIIKMNTTSTVKHIVCYSGGHSSALVAIEVVRKYGKENVVLLNHDINQTVENEDIKRFKREVANYLQLPITFANNKDFETKDQFDIALDSKGFKFGHDSVQCTFKLKTEPFKHYLKENFPRDKEKTVLKDCVIYYGFDANETARIQRRVGILLSDGYLSDYPLALWKDRTIHSTLEIGITPPNTYSVWKHANCTGCLKAGKQHWYLVYLHRRDLFEKAKAAEEIIGHSIMKNDYLSDLEDEFKVLADANVETTEHEDGRTFAARARRIIKTINIDEDQKPCECVF